MNTFLSCHNFLESQSLGKEENTQTHTHTHTHIYIYIPRTKNSQGKLLKLVNALRPRITVLLTYPVFSQRKSQPEHFETVANKKPMGI